MAHPPPQPGTQQGRQANTHIDTSPHSPDPPPLLFCCQRGKKEGRRRDGRPHPGDQCGGQGRGPRRRLGLPRPTRRPLHHRPLGRRRHDPSGGAERAADDAGDRRQPGHLPHGHDARRQRRGGQRRHQLHGHLLHALPPRRLRRRLLPRSLPHHRHLHRHPSVGRDDPDDLHGGAGAAPAFVPGQRRRALRARVGRAARHALPGPVPDGAGHRRAQVERVRVRLRPVRRDQRRREVADDALLQLVLLLHQPRLAAGRHRARLRPGQPRPAVGLRRLRRLHRRGARHLPRRHPQVPLQEAGREPAHADRRRRRVRLAQAPRRAPRAPRHALRHRRRQGRRRRGGLHQEEQAQGAHPAHQAVPFPGPRGDQRRPRRREYQVAAGDADGRGGGEDGGADAAHLGDDDHVLDGVRADDHLLGVAGHHHGPPHRPVLRDPRRLAHRLLRRLHPAHRAHLRPPHRSRGAPAERQPARPHPAPAHRHRPGHVRARHGRRRAHRGPAAPRGAGQRHPRRRRRAHDRVLAHPAVPARRLRRGLHLHRPARLLPARVPQGHEDHEHGALPQHALARLLRQLRARHRRAEAHRPRPPLDRRQPQQGRALQVLLAPRRALPRQLLRLPRRRQVVQVQGRPTRRRRQRQRRRDGRAVPPLTDRRSSIGRHPFLRMLYY